MNKKITIILASILVQIFSIVTIPEAQTMTSGGLNAKQDKIVTIAAFTASGDLGKLKTALGDGLDAGLTINEIKEILVQMYAYAGFPRSLNGINTFMGVLEEREKKGIKDVLGKEPDSLPTKKSSIELGTEIQTTLAGRPITGALYAFTPAIDQFLKAHLFGDIFGRNNLDFQSREIATISALAGMEGVNPQLQAHFNIGFNTGLTKVQMQSLISVLEARVGKKQADNAREILGKVLTSRQAEQDSRAISITRDGSHPSFSGPADHFTGSVHVDLLFKAHDPSRTTGGRVTFEPGARTAWHTHPFGQYLIVIAGSGRVQRWGGPIEEIKAGDVVWFPPGLKHWHGAAPTVGMTHIAIQEEVSGKSVVWMEKVSDEQYQAKTNVP